MTDIKKGTENLRSISINDLIVGENGKKFCFIIPAYQRGYRWDEEHIVTLLDDLFEFNNALMNKDATVGDFYCLQPIVIKSISKDSVLEKMGINYEYKENEQYYEVIDGQQRLTTIYIMLKSFFDRNPNYFDIEYERDTSHGFTRKNLLEKLSPTFDVKGILASSADEYYFVEAFKNIGKWLQEKNSTNSNIDAEMQTVLKQKTKIIWYELTEYDNIDCYSVFRNINNGKIPLTDAELVKAMLLSSKYFSPNTNDKITNDNVIRREQERYARLWDEIQHSLNNNQLWTFITGNFDFKVSTRIDFLFKIAVMSQEPNYNQEGDLRLFSYYEGKIKNLSIKNKKVYLQSIFDNLRKIYRTVQDWFANNEIYNYVGFITTYIGKNVTERLSLIVRLMDNYEHKTRPEFVHYLIGIIKNEIIGKKVTLEFLNVANYEDDRSVIEKLLMLFNIAELNKIGEKFNFYTENGWSVEHIKAQHSQIADPKDRGDFLKKEKLRIEKTLESLNSEKDKKMYTEIIGYIDTALKKSIEEEEFLRIAEKIDLEVDGFDDSDMHRMGNLALLGKSENSSFGNSPFYEKREKLLPWLDNSQKNIPYSTKRVFLKMYSEQSFNLDFTKWSKTDFKMYFKKQCELLKDFIAGGSND